MKIFYLIITGFCIPIMKVAFSPVPGKTMRTAVKSVVPVTRMGPAHSIANINVVTATVDRNPDKYELLISIVRSKQTNNRQKADAYFKLGERAELSSDMKMSAEYKRLARMHNAWAEGEVASTVGH